MKLQVLQDTPIVSVYFDTKNNWLFTDWHGELTLPLVQAGCLTIAECFLQCPCTRILNSNADVTSLSPDVPAWVALEYLPHLDLAGIEYLAWVRPPNVLHRRLVDESLSRTDVLSVSLFDHLADAYTWLHDLHVPLPDNPPQPTSAEQRAELDERVAALGQEMQQHRNRPAAPDPVVAPTNPEQGPAQPLKFS